jgi:hypothetical protein
MKKVVVATTLLLLAGLFVLAQSAEYEACEDLDVRVASVQELAVALDANAESIAEDIAGLGREIGLLDAECRGLSFSSEIDGLQPLLGPMILDGVYRVTLTTDGFAIVAGTVLDGDCEREVRTIFNIREGEGDDGAQIALDTDGECEVLFEISNTREDWTLTFEKLR